MEDLKLFTIIYRVNNYLNKQAQNHLSQFDLSASQFGILEMLYHKGSLSIKEIKEKLIIPYSSLNYTVESLIKKGYIVKSCDQQDRRSFVLSLIDKHKEFVGELFYQHKNFLLKFFSSLSKDEIQITKDVLKRIGKGEYNEVLYQPSKK